MSSTTNRRLEDWIQLKTPEERIRLSSFSAPSSGRSSDTQLFTLFYGEGVERFQKLVLRRAPIGRGHFPSYDMGAQAGIMNALARTSVRVPTVRWYESDPSVIGSPFIVMDHIDGSVPTDTPPGIHGQGLFFESSEAKRSELWYATLDQMVRLHALPWRHVDLPKMIGAVDDAQHSASAQIEQMQQWLAWSEAAPMPVIDAGLDWLRSTKVSPSRLSILWGDARPGNVIYQNGEVAAMLDWEMSTIGLPAIDLTYFIWTTDLLANLHGVPRLPGLPVRQETLQRYEELAGRKIENLEYCEVYTLVRLSIMLALAARTAVEVNAHAHENVYTHEHLQSNPVINTLREFLA